MAKSISELTQAETELIRVLREAVADIGGPCFEAYTDFDYLRWLQGYDFKIDSIVPLLRQHMKDFQLWNLQHVVEEGEDPVSAKYYPKGLFSDGPCKDNNLLYIEMIGKLDSVGLMKSASLLTLARSRVHTAETLLAAIRKQETVSGKQTKLVFVMDLDGLTWEWSTLWNMTSGPYRWLCDYSGQHYVELIYKFIVINAPPLVHHLWTIIRPWFAPRIRDKTIILGKDFQPELLRYANEDKLPKHWGGKLVDKSGDEMCRSMVLVPEPIPDSLHWIKPDPESDPRFSNFVQLIVPAGSSKFVSIECHSVSTSLNWLWLCDRTYAVGIYFAENEEVEDLEHLEPVFPFFQKLQGPLEVPEEGKLVCKKPGFYKFRFENQGSWWYSLHVQYHITICQESS